MTPGELLADLERREIRLFVEDGFFRYEAPKGTFDDQTRVEVRRLREVFLTEWLCSRCLNVGRFFIGFKPNVCCPNCFERGRV